MADLDWRISGMILRTVTIDGVSADALSGVKWLPNSTHSITIKWYNNDEAIKGLAMGLRLGANVDDAHMCWFYGSAASPMSISVGNGQTRTFSSEFTISNTVNADEVYLYGTYRKYNSSTYKTGSHIIPGLSYRFQVCNPMIDLFTVERVTAESKHLYVKAHGSYVENPTFGLNNQLVFEYRIGAGDWESATDAQENVFTIANLCSTGGIAATLPMNTASDFFELDFTEYAVFRLRFFNEYETGTTVTVTVPVVRTNFHLAGCKTGGASFGGFSQSTEDHPLFECYYPAKFYAGVEGAGGSYSTSEEPCGKWLDGKTIYSKTFSMTVPAKTSAATDTLLTAAQVAAIGIDSLVKIEGISYQANGVVNILPAYYSSSNFRGVYLAADGSLVIRHQEANSSNSNDVHVTLYYTKTT